MEVKALFFSKEELEALVGMAKNSRADVVLVRKEFMRLGGSYQAGKDFKEALNFVDSLIEKLEKAKQ